MNLFSHLRAWWQGEELLSRSVVDSALEKALATQEEKHRRRLVEPTRARHLPLHQELREPGGKGPRKVMGYSAHVLRLFSRFSPTLRAVIDIRKREVASSEWDVVPKLDRHEKELDTLRQLVLSLRRFPDRADIANKWEPDYLDKDLVRALIEATRSPSVPARDMRYRFQLALQDLTREAETHAAQVRPLFDSPHPTWTWADILKAIVPDILVLDSGCLELQRAQYPLDPEQKKLGKEVPRPDNKILQLHWVDGATVRPCVDEHGMFRGLEDPHELAYEQWINDQRVEEGGWKQHELLRIIENPQTDINFLGYGFSRTETLVMTALLEASADKADQEEFKRDFYGGFLNIKDPAFQQEDVEAVRHWIEEALEGTRKLPITAFADMEYHSANPSSSNRDKRGDERRKNWRERVCAIFEIPPLKLGAAEKTNYRNSDVGQEQMDDGLRSLLDTLDDNVNGSIVSCFGYNDIAYKSYPQHMRDEQKKVELLEKQAELGLLDVNDMRMEYGKEPLDLGDRSIHFFREFEKARGQAEGMQSPDGAQNPNDDLPPEEGMLDDNQNADDPDNKDSRAQTGKGSDSGGEEQEELSAIEKALVTQTLERARAYKERLGAWPELTFEDEPVINDSLENDIDITDEKEEE